MSLQVWLPLNGDLTNQGLSGNLTVTNSGATVDNSGKIGKCYAFSGSQYAKITNVTTIPTNSWSLAAWVYPMADSSSGHQYIVGMNTSTASDFLGELCYYINKFSVRTGGTTYSASSTSALNTWYHIAATYNGTTLKLYVNGVQAGSWNSPTAPVASTTVYICTRGGITGNFQGKLNDVRIYDHALSPKEIEEIAKGLVLHYKLDGENQILVPSGYQQLEYLESTGTQYINTGKVPQDTYEYRFKYALTAFDAYKGPFCAYSAEAANTVRIIPDNGSNSNVLIYFNCKAGGGNLNITGLTSAANQIVEGSLSKKSYYLKNITSNIVKSDSNATDLFPTKGTAITANMCLFGYSGYISKSRIYYFDTYNNGACIQKLVPAKRLSDNVLGMYDVISKTFFTNAGTGTFTAGPNALISSPIYDSSGYSNNGTIVGSLTAAAPSPRYEVATAFNGSSLIEADPLPAETLTLSAWVNFADTSGSAYRMVVHDKNSGLAIGYYSSKIITYVGSSAGGTGSCVTASLAANTWYHIVVVKTGATTRDTYINGVKATTTSNNYQGGDLVKFHIGGRHVSGSYSGYTTGKIVDVRAYATALTADQVKELYNTSMSVDSNGNIHARELSEL